MQVKRAVNGGGPTLMGMFQAGVAYILSVGYNPRSTVKAEAEAEAAAAEAAKAAEKKMMRWQDEVDVVDTRETWPGTRLC